MAFSLLARRTLFTLGITLHLVAGCGGGDDGSGGSGGSGGGDVEPELEPFALPAQAWSHGDPTPLEQALLEEIQRARLNPNAEVEVILAVPGVKTAMQQFGTSEDQLRSDFMTYAPVPPLSFDVKLMASSRAHSQDMATNGFQDHDSFDGTSFDQRIDEAGYDWSFVSENIFAYAESVPYCHAAFMVDWGNPDPGHRKAILDIDGEKRDIGISIIEQPASPDVGPLVVTQDFAMPMKPPPNAARYIVGVAYRDLDGSGTYTPGEGVSGHFIVPERGDYYAVTSTSGGFSVPITRDAGTLPLQIQDETNRVLDQWDVTLTGENVKLDFLLPPQEQ